MRLMDIVSLILVGIILLTLIIVLIALTRKEKEKLRYELDRYLIYKRALSEVSSKNNIENLDKLFRGFLKEIYGFDYNLTYLEISEKLKQKNINDLSKLCILMSKIIYSGREIDSKDVKRITKYFEEILNKFL